MTRRWSVRVLAVVGAVALVGCGGGKKAAPGTTPSGATTSSATGSTTTTATGSTTTTATGSTTTGKGVPSVPSMEQLESALLADGDVPGFKVEKGNDALASGADSPGALCAVGKPDYFAQQGGSVGVQLTSDDAAYADTTFGYELLEAAPATEMEQVFTEARDMVEACDGKPMTLDASGLSVTIAKTAGPQLGNETVSFDLVYPGPESLTLKVHSVLVRSGTVKITVSGAEVGPGGFDAAATADLARRALDKVTATLG